jgi:hypothetical protein
MNGDRSVSAWLCLKCGNGLRRIHASSDIAASGLPVFTAHRPSVLAISQRRPFVNPPGVISIRLHSTSAKGAGLSPRRLALKQDLLNLDVDSMISSLDAHIASGCCEPALKTLEADVKTMAWPALVAATKSKLITQIIAAQGRARKDFKHC